MQDEQVGSSPEHLVLKLRQFSQAPVTLSSFLLTVCCICSVGYWNVNEAMIKGSGVRNIGSLQSRA